MLRIIICFLATIIYLVLTLPLLMYAHFLGKKDLAKKDAFSKKYVRFAFRLLMFLAGVKLTVKGRDNIPDDTAVLYIGNHRSNFDVIITYTLIKGYCGYVAKTEMLKVPILRAWMKNIGCIFIDRNDIKQGFKAILQGIERIKAGYSLFVFPEGHRASGEEFLEFHAGSFKLAEKSGVPIVPVAISGSRQIWEGHFPAIKSTRVIVEFLRPVVIKDLPEEGRKSLGEYLRNEIYRVYLMNNMLIN